VQDNDDTVVNFIECFVMCDNKERQWELQQRAAQLTQLDMAMKDQSSDWDQRLIRLDTSLKKSRLEAEQRLQQVRQLEEQVAELMAALKEKTAKVDSNLVLYLCKKTTTVHAFMDFIAKVHWLLISVPRHWSRWAWLMSLPCIGLLLLITTVVECTF